MTVTIATAIAFACGLIAGLPQIARMIRQRSSASQSPAGWAIGAKGAAATAYVGIAQGATPLVYGPSIAAAVIAAAGFAVTVHYSGLAWAVRGQRIVTTLATTGRSRST